MESDAKNHSVAVGDAVKYKFEIEPANSGPKLNGVIKFYDGDTEITGSTEKCQPLTLTNEGEKKSSTCEITYTGADIGTHGIAAVFFSTDTCSDSSCYANVEAILDPAQVVTGGNDSAGDIEIKTNGNVQLTSPGSGAYKGIVLFQDRTSDGAIELSYGSGKAACSPTSQITRKATPSSFKVMASSVSETTTAAASRTRVRIAARSAVEPSTPSRAPSCVALLTASWPRRSSRLRRSQASRAGRSGAPA